MNCPLCEYKGLADDAINCPSCHADLSVYLALDAVELSMQKQKKRTLLFIILFFLAFLACFVIYFIFATAPADDKSAESAVYETQLKAMQDKNEQLSTANEALQSENAKLKEVKEEAASPKQLTHVIKDGESLYFIAKKYLGNGNLYPGIATDNGIENPDIIITGTTLIINK